MAILSEFFLAVFLFFFWEITSKVARRTSTCHFSKSSTTFVRGYGFEKIWKYFKGILLLWITSLNISLGGIITLVIIPLFFSHLALRIFPSRGCMPLENWVSVRESISWLSIRIYEISLPIWMYTFVLFLPSLMSLIVSLICWSRSAGRRLIPLSFILSNSTKSLPITSSFSKGTSYASSVLISWLEEDLDEDIWSRWGIWSCCDEEEPRPVR